MLELGRVRIDHFFVLQSKHIERIAVLCRQGNDRFEEIVDDWPDNERLEFERHFSGFDFRDVQNVVDEREQVIAGLLNFLQIGGKGRIPFLA
ncbi:MAG: hypothetical protein QM811_28135 [Pirellulales bacterium]